MELPVEILAFILCKLDGTSLVCAKRVCKLWYNICTKLDSVANIWLRTCAKEIAFPILIELTDSASVAHVDWADLQWMQQWNQYSWMYWREVYAEYQRVHCIRQRKAKVHHVELGIGHGSITAMKLHDNTLICGYMDGTVLIHEDLPEPVSTRELKKHNCHVTAIGCMKFENNVSHGAVSVIVSVSKGCEIKLLADIENDAGDANNIYDYHYHSKPIHSLSCFGNSFVTGALDTMLHGQPIIRVNWTDGSVHADLHTKLFGHKPCKITCTAMWMNKVVTGNEEGHLLLWSVDDDAEHPQSLHELDGQVRDLVFRDQLIIAISGKGMLYGLVLEKGVREVNAFSLISSLPECIALHGSLFAIGTKSGFVFMYIMQTLEDWYELDIGQPCSQVSVNTDHITGIQIGDDGLGPVVIASTGSNSVKMITWHALK